MVDILCLSANPFDDLNMDPKRELKIIQEALRKSPFADEISLHWEDDVEFPELPRLLMQYSPKILHLAIPSFPQAGLYFNDCRPSGMELRVRQVLEGQISVGVAWATFAGVLESFRQNIELLFFTTPIPEQEAEELTHFTAALIGFDYFVDNKRAFAFTQGFYEGFAMGRGLTIAYDRGCYRLSQVPHETPIRPPFLRCQSNDPGQLLTLQRLAPFVQSGIQPAAGSGAPRVDRSLLRDNLVRHFGMADLRTLMFDMNIDYERLPHDTTDELAREIVRYCERSDRVNELRARCQTVRPNATW